MKLRQRLITSLLKHEGLVSVPIEWQKEYVKLAGEKVHNAQVIQSIIKEYNDLLHDYYEKHSVKELKDTLKAAGIKEPLSKLNKDDLVNLATKEYKMSWEKNK